MSESPNLDRHENEAREWFLLMQLQAVSSDEREQFEHWLSANESHQRAYRQMEVLWQDLAGLRESGELDAMNAADRGFFSGITEAARALVENIARGLPRPRMAAAVFASVLAVALIALLMPRGGEAGWERYSTTTGELRELRLGDGSVVTLGADSSVKIRMQKDRRLVELLRGRAFFDVSRDVDRPFLVVAGDTRVRVLGTRFDINRIPGRVQVAVLEGEVSVALREFTDHKPDAPAEWRLTSGQRIEAMGRDSMSPVFQVDLSELGAWREGRLVYRSASLLEVIADANRYYAGSITLVSDTLGELRVSASFRTDQIELLLDMLAETLPVELRRESGNEIVIMPERDGGAGQETNIGYKRT